MAAHKARYFRRGGFSVFALAIAILLPAPAALADRNSTAAFDEYQPPCSVYPDQPGCNGNPGTGNGGKGTGDHHGDQGGAGGGAGGGSTGGAAGGGAAGGGPQGGGLSGSVSVDDGGGGADLPFTGYPLTSLIVVLALLLGGGVLLRLGVAGAGRLRQARATAGTAEAPGRH